MTARALLPLLAISRPTLSLFGTLFAYEIGLRLQRRCRGNPLVNPVLIAVVLVASGLAWSGMPTGDYSAGVQPLILLLGPATVALALPLFRSWAKVRVAVIPILASVVVGALTATATAVGVAMLLGAPDLLLRSIATKTATAAIAMAVAPQIGGDPSLAAGISVMTGIVGAVSCKWVLDWSGVRSIEARGLATGVSAHGIGTAYMLTVSAEAGAFSGLAMGLTGLTTGVVLPLAYAWCTGTGQ